MIHCIRNAAFAAAIVIALGAIGSNTAGAMPIDGKIAAPRTDVSGVPSMQAVRYYARHYRRYGYGRQVYVRRYYGGYAYPRYYGAYGYARPYYRPYGYGLRIGPRWGW